MERELRTLKDMQKVLIKGIDNKTMKDDPLVFKRDLRAEAVKWLKGINKDIYAFKGEVYNFTSWKTGESILNYLDSEDALKYGEFLGKRDVLMEFLNLTEEDLKEQEDQDD